MLISLGLVFVLFALLSVFLLLFGAPTDLTWIWVNFVIGVVLLASGIASNANEIREWLRSGESRRIGKYGSSAVAQAAIAIAIVVLLSLLANRYHWRYDASQAHVHSLSDQTQKVLAGLERDVEVTAFFQKLDQPAVRTLLDRYRYVSDKVKVDYADPNARPDLIERMKIAPEKIGKGLLHVQLGDETVDISEPDEEKLTNALVKLTRTAHKKAYFLTGHNERAVEGKGADEKDGFARAADALRDENYRFETLNLATKGDVPDDADVVIIAGPTQPFRPEEHAALQRYLERGGALFAMVDPRAHTDLVADLDRWGVALGDDAVVDRVQSLFGQAMSPMAAEYGTHEITKDLREVTLFPMTRSVQPRKGAESRFVELVKTSKESWAERDLDTLFNQGRAELGADDLKGPVPIAVAGAPLLDGAKTVAAADKKDDPKKKEARLVVFGDSDFAANETIDAYRNRDLFVNSVNWLLGDVEAIAVRPNKSRASRLTLSTEQFTQIRYLSLFVLPELIAVVGVLAWWSRRRAPGR
ncbi:MAG TPA: Gldg family protein [Myxococcota bacterium]|nr:Gldg family protein [Myxococcota bacterium]